MVGDPVEGLEEDEPTATKVLARAQVAGADSVVAAEVETGGRGAAAMAVAMGAAVVTAVRSFSNEPWSRIRGSR